MAHPSKWLSDMPQHWRKNGAKLTKRKAIRAEARSRWFASGRIDRNAEQVYDWAHDKIRAFYDVAPLSVVWPINRGGA